MVILLVFTIISVASLATSNECNNLDTDVLILGGGMTGVAAANRLQALGRKFLLFEARQNLGGRMRRTEVFPGVFSSTGPYVIHGVDPRKPELHPIYKVMQDCGGLEGAYFGDTKVYNGSADVTTLYKNKLNMFYQAYEGAANIAEERQRQNLPDISFGDALRQSGWVPQTPLENFTDWLGFDYCAAVDPYQFSLFAVFQDTTFTDFVSSESKAMGEEGQDYLITDSRGFVHLVNCLASNFSSNQVHLNSMVTKINNNNECVCIEVSQSNGNNRYCGRYAILTFSIGVIKSESFRSVLSPYFSQAKQEALEILTMANFLKIHLQFNERFWDDNVTDIGRVDLQRGNYPVFTTAYISSNPNALLLILTEDLANEALAMDMQSLNNSITDALRDIYGSNVSTLTNIYREMYYNDPLVLGTFVTVNTGLKKDTYNVIQSPEMSLYLAGEGISEKYPGYSHGSYLTGISASERIDLAIGSSGCASYGYSMYLIFLVLLVLIA